MEKLIDRRMVLNEFTGCNEYNYQKNSYISSNMENQIEHLDFKCEPITPERFKKESQQLQNAYYNTYIGPISYFNFSPYKY